MDKPNKDNRIGMDWRDGKSKKTDDKNSRPSRNDASSSKKSMNWRKGQTAIVNGDRSITDAGSIRKSEPSYQQQSEDRKIAGFTFLENHEGKVTTEGQYGTIIPKSIVQQPHSPGDGNISLLLSDLSLYQEEEKLDVQKKRIKQSKCRTEKFNVQRDLTLDPEISQRSTVVVSSSAVAFEDFINRESASNNSKFTRGFLTAARSRDLNVPPLIKPKPADEYTAQAKQPSIRLLCPQPLLIILDLNGTLLYRDKRTRSFRIQERPYLGEFLGKLFKEHVGLSDAIASAAVVSLEPSMSLAPFSVMVWSSACPNNVTKMCSKIMSHQQRCRLVDVWARDRLGLSSAQYKGKAQTYKQLQWVWQAENIKSTYPAYEARNGNAYHVITI